jgi:hypothetical protein
LYGSHFFTRAESEDVMAGGNEPPEGDVCSDAHCFGRFHASDWTNADLYLEDLLGRCEAYLRFVSAMKNPAERKELAGIDFDQIELDAASEQFADGWTVDGTLVLAHESL